MCLQIKTKVTTTSSVYTWCSYLDDVVIAVDWYTAKIKFTVCSVKSLLYEYMLGESLYNLCFLNTNPVKVIYLVLLSEWN